MFKRIFKLNCSHNKPLFLIFEHLKDIISGDLLVKRNGWFNEGRFPSLSLLEKPPSFYGTGNIS